MTRSAWWAVLAPLLACGFDASGVGEAESGSTGGSGGSGTATAPTGSATTTGSTQTGMPTTTQPGETTSDTSADTAATVTTTRGSESGEAPVGFHRPITIAGALADADLEAFPVLVHVTDDALRHVGEGGHVLEVDGGDLAFWDADGAVQLPHELTGYRPQAGIVVAWVRVDLSAGVDTTIDLRYGAPAVPARGSVWDDAFAGVWHFDALDADVVPDSATMMQDATAVELVDAIEAGQIGAGLSFPLDTSTAVVEGNALELSGDVTLEGWGRMDGALAQDGFQRLFHQGSGTTCNLCTWVEDGTPGTTLGRMGFYIAGVSTSGLGVTIPGFAFGQWHHWAWVVDDGVPNVTFYLDGAPLQTFGLPNGISLGAASFAMGNRHQTASRRWNGVLDELRASSTARSAAWIAATAANAGDPGAWVTLGPESPLP